ncbi:MAG: class I SAM-dependent methyltransferase [Desulfurococcales archaeon]|nr:class I SAM-dependent methyltransferase [Desulfurococcales archaeon]
MNKFFIKYGELFLCIMNSRWETAGEEVGYIISLFKKHGINKDAKILDLGCGNGRISINLALKGYRVTGIDISPLYIEDALKKARDYGVEDKVEFFVGDARKLKEVIGDRRFDTILMYWTTILGYYDEETDRNILRQCRDVVGDKGYLFILNTASRDRIAFISSFIPGPEYFNDLGDMVMVEKPVFDPVKSVLNNKWVFYRKDGKNLVYVDELEFTLRLYSLHEIVSMAKEAGWTFIEAYSSLKTLSPYRPVLGGHNIVFKAVS